MNIDALVESFYRKEDKDSDLISEVLKFLLMEEEVKMPPRARFESFMEKKAPRWSRPEHLIMQRQYPSLFRILCFIRHSLRW